MRINQIVENGNVAGNNSNEIFHFNDAQSNESWLVSDSLIGSRSATDDDNIFVHSNFNSNYDSSEAVKIVDNRDTTETEYIPQRFIDNVETTVCNRQYRINTQNKNIITSSNNTLERNLDEDLSKNRTKILINADCSLRVNVEKKLEESNTNEMSDNGTSYSVPLPRGIVNPNYPGFQHLAHTLQDYSTTIENFYHSENDMTDDDLDTEVIDVEQNLNETSVEIPYNNNNNNYDIKGIQVENIRKEQCTLKIKEESQTLREIPDLLKTISNNNNNNINLSSYDCCSETDIENNFHTKDIIGDFNKEIEDEIKQLLNYNINIQDDLEELRKDIKDTFTEPIESTINNISDVVNHVIKKLVETKTEVYVKNDEISESNTVVQYCAKENVDMNAENETNSKTEMNLNRPKFLLIENNDDNKISDAILSDGKDEINIYENEYDTEALSHNVENTIKQLSTELRKIIPKLNEMRERDKLWTENKNFNVTDNNCNKISTNTASCCSFLTTATIETKGDCGSHVKSGINAIFSKNLIQVEAKDRQIKDDKHNAQSNESVRHHENLVKDYEFDSFDVYNIETALPKLDLDAIENHLKAAKDAERRKRNDREEIRKRLAMGAESEEFYSLGHIDRPGKKPSLHSRLQNGKNLQICFMNETASDNESQASDVERSLTGSSKSLSRSSIYSKSSYNHPYQTRPLSVNISNVEKMSTIQSTKLRPSSLSLKPSTKPKSTHSLNHIDIKESDFYTLQATLQTEARIALAQAKEMAHIQMERERRARAVSPVTEMLRRSMEKAGAPLAAERRRVSRQLLTDMNIAQLQVIVNELHGQTARLSEALVSLLLARDDLHMGQDSMLVDIEDLTRYLGVKEQTKKTKGTNAKSGVRRLTSLVHK